MNEYLISRALYLNSTVEDEPDFDTLIGICNPFDTPQQFTIRCFDSKGGEVGTLAYILQPGRSIATTFIRGNVFLNPPQNWQGYARIEFADKALPAMACLGGGGPTPINWNFSTPNVPIIGASGLMTARGLYQRWMFPYVIPHFADPIQHFGEHEYRAGLSVTNLGVTPRAVRLKFTVGDVYPEAGQTFETSFNVDPFATFTKQVHELLPQLLEFNSEGWLDITTDAPADLMLYLLCANRDYNFLGWGQSPFIL